MSDVPSTVVADSVPPQQSGLEQLVTLILQRLDGRIDGRVEALRAELNTYLEERDTVIRAELEKMYMLMAEVASGAELGLTFADAWREFVVTQAAKLEVKASEIIAVRNAQNGG